MTESEIYDLLLPHLVQVLEYNAVGADSVVLRARKDFSGIQYIKPEQLDEYGKPVKTRTEALVCRIVARKGKFLFELPCGDRYAAVPFHPNPDGIAPHIPAVCAALDAAIDAAACEYSCCSRAEQCSDARRCINPYPHIAANCNYRKILKSGRVYYGKNRNIDG